MGATSILAEQDYRRRSQPFSSFKRPGISFFSAADLSRSGPIAKFQSPPWQIPRTLAQRSTGGGVSPLILPELIPLRVGLEIRFPSEDFVLLILIS